MLRITHMLATTAFSELYITVSRQQGTFLSNRCINEMHYTYQITRRQVSSFASPRYDFAAKHISRKMLHSYSFFFLWRKTDRIQWIPCDHLLVWFYAEKRKNQSLDHFSFKIFLNLSTTIKPKSSWNIPLYMRSIRNWILDFLAK